ncbi:MAG: hypothetical protein O2887_19005 [Bacteroidetes bacterium]|nr:hypothetical protein [Bacteroidota bacterium]MDA1122543.1 hypothetical protein [Bacteroidota bacterium]
MIDIRKVETKNQLRYFIDFPHEMYIDDPCYVPELFIAQKDLLSKKHPFFQHSKADLFLAYKDGKLTGRVAAIRNNNYISYTGNKIGFFGFLDFIDNYSVSEALLMTVSNWLKDEELTGMMGPENYSTNDTCGTLIEGFDSPPMVMMTYNKAYYPDHLERFGLSKAMDLIAYRFIQSGFTERLQRVGKMLEARLQSKGITIRKFNTSKFSEEIERIKKIYNSAWEKNWGFVPMTDEEFVHTAKDLKQIVDPDFLLIAECEGEPIGYTLTLPDFNEVLIKVKKGRLLPLGLIKILLNKKNIKGIRIITLGIIEQYRKLGIDAFFYFKAYEEALKKGITIGEASWVLENNEIMNRAILNINGEPYKKYRLYSMNF